MELSAQLKGMRKLVKDNQEERDAQRELEMPPDVPMAGRRVMVKTVCQLMGIKQKFHIPYHPQSSGMVGRMNRTHKNTRAKPIQTLRKMWTEVLPTILM